jgi:hypothetical protein
MKIGDRVIVSSVASTELEYVTAGIGSKGTVSFVFSSNLCEVAVDEVGRLNFTDGELTRLEDE